jgi:hypothetical protein
VIGDAGLFRFVAGADAYIPFGRYHVAYSGDARIRQRIAVYGGAGVRWLQVTGGYLFPYHPSVGARLTIPLDGGYELGGGAIYGLPPTRERDDGTTWNGLPVVGAWFGVTATLGL